MEDLQVFQAKTHISLPPIIRQKVLELTGSSVMVSLT